MRALIIEIALLRMRFDPRMSLKRALRNEGALKCLRSETKVGLNACAQ